MSNNLEFDEQEHKYFVDGNEVPSVTHILRFLNTDIASNASSYMRDIAADRGTRVHQACELIDYTNEYSPEDFDADILPYLNAYKEFKRDYMIGDWSLIEAPMCIDGPAPIAGTIDRYGDVLGKKTLVDIKTSGTLNMKTYSNQLFAYESILEENGYKVDRLAILHLRKDGSYQFKTVSRDDYENVLIHCYIINEYLEGGKNGKRKNNNEG